MKSIVWSMLCVAALSPAALAADAYADLVAQDHPILHERFDNGARASAAPSLGKAMQTADPISIALPKPLPASGDVTIEWWQWIDELSETTLLSGAGEDGARLFQLAIRIPETETKKKNPLAHYAFADGDTATLAAAPYPARWSHLAIVLNADGTGHFFVNGCPITPVRVGIKRPLTQITLAPDHLKGAVDELAIYDHALKPDEIKSHFLAAVHSLPTHQVIVLGHRGDNKGSPENTRISYINAIQHGAKFVEMDLHLTRDKHIVLMHDDTVTRTTGEKGKVSDYTRDEITRLDAGSWKDAKYKGEPVPRIEDIGEACRGKAVMMLDLKSTGQGPQIAEWLKAANFPMDGIILAPWSEEEGIALRKFLPEPVMTQLSGKVPAVYDDAYFSRLKSIGFTIVSINWQNLPQDFIAAAHRNGMKVHSWTFNRHGASGNTDVDGASEVAGAVLAGVDGIITDDTVATQKQVDEFTSR